MPKISLPLEDARVLGQQVLDVLWPGCERIEIAGSVRRGKPACGDLEIVAIPSRQSDLLGQPLGSLLDPILKACVSAGRLREPTKNGDRYKRFEFVKATGFCLDLFLVRVETWAVQFAIRTGPADYSKRLVTPQRLGGLLPDNCRVRDGRVWRQDGAGPSVPLPFLEEDEFLDLCGGAVPPEGRG